MSGSQHKSWHGRHIAIAGLGMLGGSVALRARGEWPDARLTGFDRPDLLKEALRRGVIDAAAERIEGLAEADLIVLALPIDVMLGVVARLGRAGTGAIVTDVGSTKVHITDAARSHGIARFVGGHPMAGTEHSGLDHARVTMFDGRPWLLVPSGRSDDTDTRVEAFVRALGAAPKWMDAATHDRTMAYVSHMVHVVSAVLMNVAADAVGADGLEIAGTSLTDMTRLAASPPALWQGILADNADLTAEALQRVAAALPTVADLEHGTWTRDAFTRAGAARSAWRGTIPAKG